MFAAQTCHPSSARAAFFLPQTPTAYGEGNLWQKERCQNGGTILAAKVVPFLTANDILTPVGESRSRLPGVTCQTRLPRTYAAGSRASSCRIRSPPACGNELRFGSPPGRRDLLNRLRRRPQRRFCQRRSRG